MLLREQFARYMLLGGVMVSLIPPAFSQNPEPVPVTLQLVNAFGKPVSSWELIEFGRTTNANVDYSADFDKEGHALVTPGRYRLHAFGPFDEPEFLTEVEVKAPSTLLVIGGDFSGQGGSPSEKVDGRFEIPPGDEVSCGLSSVYTPDKYFSSVREDGTFNFSWVKLGRYFLSCFDGGEPDKIFYTALVTVEINAKPSLFISAPEQIPTPQ